MIDSSLIGARLIKKIILKHLSIMILIQFSIYDCNNKFEEQTD